MDPDASLAEQRTLRKKFIAAFDACDPDTGDWTTPIDPIDAYRLAELQEALDEWIARGGRLPAAWQR